MHDSRNSIIDGPPPEYFEKPRTAVLKKSAESGFGFNIRGQVNDGGQLKAINGVLYAPLQHVSAVTENGPAELAGIRQGDRILSVNNVSVEGATHKQVVNLIKNGGDTITLKLISVKENDVHRLDPDDEYIFDFSDTKAIDISVPSSAMRERFGSKYGKIIKKRPQIIF